MRSARADPRRPILAAFVALIAFGTSLSPGPVAEAQPENSLAATAPAAVFAPAAIVRIQNLKFVPPVVQIRVGQQVVWRNVDTVIHTVSSDTFGSGRILRGGEFAATFPRPGTYPYSCQIHPSMKGWVVAR